MSYFPYYVILKAKRLFYIEGEQKNMLKGKTVVLGVTGSIAAYKAANLASMLVKLHADVHVIMTKNATNFIHPITFETLTNHKCLVDTFDRNFQYSVEHVALAKKADVMMIAPATANVIGKLAGGIADDMLTTTALACTCPKLIAPAMNTRMFENSIVQDNLKKLTLNDYQVIQPAVGFLACRDEGTGKLPKEEELLEYILKEIACEKDMKGLRVLVTAGPTMEAMDPVRYITNHSTGKMGYAIAEQARDMGADVTLVSGPVTLSAPRGIDTVHVTTAQQMFNAVQEHFTQADLTIMAAAVGDFRPIEQSSEKIKKNGRVNIDLRLTSNPDILAWAGAHKTAGQTLCGFAMETQDLESNAAKKLTSKHCSMLVANNLNTPGAGFAVDTNVVTVLKPGETTDEPIIEHWNKMSKQELAERILTELAALRNTESAESQAS